MNPGAEGRLRQLEKEAQVAAAMKCTLPRRGAGRFWQEIGYADCGALTVIAVCDNGRTEWFYWRDHGNVSLWREEALALLAGSKVPA